MAFKSKDGKREFSMSSRSRAYDQGHPAEEPREMKSSPLQAPGGAEGEGGEEDGDAVAQEHGPADEVHVTHAEGAHHVQSMHPDGHVHESDHPSRKHAHEHAAKLAQGHAESPEEDEGGMAGGEAELGE